MAKKTGSIGTGVQGTPAEEILTGVPPGDAAAAGQSATTGAQGTGVLGTPAMDVLIDTPAAGVLDINPPAPDPQPDPAWVPAGDGVLSGTADFTAIDLSAYVQADGSVNFSPADGIGEITANGYTGVYITGTGFDDFMDFSGTLLTDIDYINGGNGADTIIGSKDADVIDGGGGNDFLDGGNGGDTYWYRGGQGTDLYHDSGTGAGDYDTILMQSGAALNWFSLDGTENAVTGIEEINGNGFTTVNILGTGGADTMDFSGINLVDIKWIMGQAGDDTIIGSQGDDTIMGNDGADTLTGGDGADIFKYMRLTDDGDTITDYLIGTDQLDLTFLARSGVTGATMVDADGDGDGLVDDLSLTLTLSDGTTVTDYLTLQDVSLSDGWNDADILL